MKRITAVLLLIIIIPCLCACKAEKNGSSGGVTSAHAATRPYEDVRLHSTANDIADGLFIGSLSDFNDEEKSMIKSYLLDRNFKIEFNEDGSAKLTRAGNEWLVSNKWPKNSYTESVPEQTIGTVTMMMESKKYEEMPEYIISIKSGDDKNAFEEYQKKLADAGFKSVGGNYYEGDEVYVGVKEGKLRLRISRTGKGYIMAITKLSGSETK